MRRNASLWQTDDTKHITQNAFIVSTRRFRALQYPIHMTMMFLVPLRFHHFFSAAADFASFFSRRLFVRLPKVEAFVYFCASLNRNAFTLSSACESVYCWLCVCASLWAGTNIFLWECLQFRDGCCARSALPSTDRRSNIDVDSVWALSLYTNNVRAHFNGRNVVLCVDTRNAPTNNDKSVERANK